jgi:hypothetical protein
MLLYTIHLIFSNHMNLKVNGEINILQTKLCNNLTDLFTKSILYSTFFKCVAGIDMRRLRDLHNLGELYHRAVCHLSIILYSFTYVSFALKIFSDFNEVMLT